MPGPDEPMDIVGHPEQRQMQQGRLRELEAVPPGVAEIRLQPRRLIG